MSLDERRKELESLPWQDVKKLAITLGISKGEGEQWEDKIEEILSKESQVSTEPIPDITPPPEPKKSKSSPPRKVSTEVKQEVYASDYYRALGFTVCPKCGEKKRTANGKVICPRGDTECPSLH